jgi:hypothetical protein
MPRPVLPSVAAAVLVLLVGGTTVPPATSPAVDPAVRAAFDRLADPDPDVRDAAREELMGLSPDEGLAKLLAVVRAAAPLRPEQACQLREIVCHVYLTGENNYPAIGDGSGAAGFTPRSFVIGIHWLGGATEERRLGVPVGERWPGFPARRLLRPGDMITGVSSDDAGQHPPPPVLPTRSRVELIDQVREAAGMHDKVVLSVLRDGRSIRIPVTLAPRPAATGEGQALIEAENFFLDRQQKADNYWRETFAPLVDPDDDAPAAAADR